MVMGEMSDYVTGFTILHISAACLPIKDRKQQKISSTMPILITQALKVKR
jgi:hypothetical protein